MIVEKEYLKQPRMELLIDADTLDYMEMENANTSYCCGAPINRDGVIKQGPYRGAGPRYCSECGVYLYRK